MAVKLRPLRLFLLGDEVMEGRGEGKGGEVTPGEGLRGSANAGADPEEKELRRGVLSSRQDAALFYRGRVGG